MCKDGDKYTTENHSGQNCSVSYVNSLNIPFDSCKLI